MGQVVAGLMVVLVQAVTGDCLGHDALFREHVIVGTLEEVLGRMRVGDQVGAVLGQFGAKIRSIPAA